MRAAVAAVEEALTVELLAARAFASAALRTLLLAAFGRLFGQLLGNERLGALIGKLAALDRNRNLVGKKHLFGAVKRYARPLWSLAAAEERAADHSSYRLGVHWLGAQFFFTEQLL